MMTKKTATIILSLVLLAISTSLLLLFFIFSNQNSKNEKPLTIFAKDLEISIGNKICNYFSISEENVDVQFFLDKPNIIEINENYIKGLELGSVKVTIKAFNEEQQSQTTFQVTVVNDGFSYEIVPISNCKVENQNNLLINQNNCQFSLNILDQYGNNLENLKYQYTISNNAELYYEFNHFILITSSNCVITLNYYEINFSIKIFCIKT